jgi:ABC-type dipeptide/oligopeptide/nickel transport system permease component
MRVLVPGDPVEIMFMGQSTDRATIEVRRELADRPLTVQYAEYRPVARGPRSIQNNRPVAEDLARYPLTLLPRQPGAATSLGLGLAWSRRSIASA